MKRKTVNKFHVAIFMLTSKENVMEAECPIIYQELQALRSKIDQNLREGAHTLRNH